jgi:mannose-1-phosphate guanylyltransferase
MNHDAYIIIMAGGIGSRFWPVSRNLLPKQFHDFLGDGQVLLRSTFDRLAPLFPPENIFVVTNTLYADLVSTHLPELPFENILQEPLGRNTAPCIAYGLFRIAKKHPNAPVLVTPSDHIIKDVSKFQQTIQNGIDIVREQNLIMTIGMKPTYSDTGFGYIQFIKEPAGPKYHKVKLFTEKPTLELARSFIKSGDFVWNSGMVLFNVPTMLDAFQQFLPDLYEIFDEIKDDLGTPAEEERIIKAYPFCKNISIDYGILEKAKNVHVIRADFGWNDLGNWGALYRQMHKDHLKNATTGLVLTFDAKNNLVQMVNEKDRREKLVVVKGVNNLIIVDTGDVLFICPKNKEQEVRDIVGQLRKDKNTYDKYL